METLQGLQQSSTSTSTRSQMQNKDESEKDSGRMLPIWHVCMYVCM